MKKAKLFLQVHLSDIEASKLLIDELLQTEGRLSHGSFYGGWHTNYTTNAIHGEIFRNAHDTRAGFGIEYHRPEFPDYDIMFWVTANSDKAFFDLEQKLNHPNIQLFITGFERGWPSTFWGAKETGEPNGPYHRKTQG